MRKTRPKPHNQWHLAEIVISIGGQRMYMWRAVDSEGEVLDVLVQRRREKAGRAILANRIAEVLEREVLVAVGVNDKDEPASAAHHLVQPEVFDVAAV